MWMFYLYLFVWLRRIPPHIALCRVIQKVRLASPETFSEVQKELQARCRDGNRYGTLFSSISVVE